MRPTALLRRSLVPVLAALLGLAACSDDKESPQDSAIPGLGVQQNVLVELDDEDFQNFLAAMKDLKEKGAAMDAMEGSDFSDAATGMRLTAEWLEVLDDHDLDIQSFQRIQYNVFMAFGALQSEKHLGQMQEEEAQDEGSAEEDETLEKDVANEIKQRMQDARAQVRNMYRDVPEANKELVKKYQAELDAVLHQR